MFAIIGLGNPGRKYSETRHNAGFNVIDELAGRMDVSVKTHRFNALCGIGHVGGKKVILVKPQTFMNNSGESVRAVVDFYKLNPESEIIVISDDMDLPVGTIRIKRKGSAGGHNGLKSIINHLGTQDFMRVKVGVGGAQDDVIDHVLGRFSKDDRKVFNDAVTDAASAACVIISEDINVAMNKYN